MNKPTSDDLALRIADAIELTIHEFRETGVSCIPVQKVGVFENGVMRLNLDDVGRIAARVVSGAYDADEVCAKNAAFRAVAQGDTP